MLVYGDLNLEEEQDLLFSNFRCFTTVCMYSTKYQVPGTYVIMLLLYAPAPAPTAPAFR